MLILINDLIKICNFYYLSSCLVIVKVHERLSLSRLLPALTSVSSVDESSRKRYPEVDVVATAGPLKTSQYIRVKRWYISLLGKFILIVYQNTV